MARAASPYQRGTVTVAHAVAGSTARAARFGSRGPTPGGRPLAWGWRGGGGSHKRASRRKRVTMVAT